MLVLSRKVGEEIIIDGDVRIIVNRISGNRVSLAIEAPNNVRVMRGELQPETTTVPLTVDLSDSQYGVVQRAG